ncbi:MAG: PrsW family glutamic-type intramembrane protease, partial [Balneolaceae bacterium]|nr:PrsW family glutamic-type intramembrane protease [Balneolaceae bacterium]
MNLYPLAEIGIAFIPILLFLAALQLFDSFKLVNLQSLMVTLLVGGAVAALAIFINATVSYWLQISYSTFLRFVAPFIEEALKIVYVVILVRANRVGFMVDAAIYGFAVGAGFAIVENTYYLNVLTEAGLSTWFVRGFGTAVMHGGTTAAAAIIIKNLAHRKNWGIGMLFIPGYAAASLLHMLYNLFILPPITLTLIILITLPPLVYAIFKASEEQTQQWLGTGLDNEMEMLQTLLAGNIADTRIGRYIKSIQDNFPDYMMADIIGYIRIYLELAVKAKGMLIMKESGIDPPIDEETKAQFRELRFLEQSIGPTGKLALQPLLKIGRTDLWQL